MSAWLGVVSYPEETAMGPKYVVSQSSTLADDLQYKLPVSDGVPPLTGTEENRQQDIYNDNKNTTGCENPAALTLAWLGLFTI